MSSPETLFSWLVTELRGKPGVTPPSTETAARRKFGSSGLRFNGKIFAMLSSEKKLVVKLPQDRVEGLVTSGDGTRFDPRHDCHVMKQWFVLNTTSKVGWLEIATEALEFAILTSRLKGDKTTSKRS